MIIGIGSKKEVGKDTVAELLLQRDEFKNYKIVKFADPLKEITAILLGVKRKKFESQEFKSKTLGKEWWVYEIPSLLTNSIKVVPYLDNKNKYSDAFLRKTTVRDLLQLIGTDCFRDIITPRIWCNVFKKRYKNKTDIIVTDVRFKEEASLIKKLGGVLIRVNRPIITSDHISETALDDYPFDIIINNDKGLDELKEKVWKLDLTKQNKDI